MMFSHCLIKLEFYYEHDCIECFLNDGYTGNGTKMYYIVNIFLPWENILFDFYLGSPLTLSYYTDENIFTVTL